MGTAPRPTLRKCCLSSHLSQMFGRRYPAPCLTQNIKQEGGRKCCMQNICDPCSTILPQFPIHDAPKADAIGLPRFWLLLPVQHSVVCVATRTWQNGRKTLDTKRGNVSVVVTARKGKGTACRVCPSFAMCFFESILPIWIRPCNAGTKTMDNTTKVSPLMGKRCATPSMRKAIKCTS